MVFILTIKDVYDTWQASIDQSIIKHTKSACLPIIESKYILDHNRKLLQALDDGFKCYYGFNNYIHFQCSLMLISNYFRCILVSMDILCFWWRNKLFILIWCFILSSGWCKPHEIHKLHEEKIISWLAPSSVQCELLAEGEHSFALGVKATFLVLRTPIT